MLAHPKGLIVIDSWMLLLFQGSEEKQDQN
jgi:hypothetical protein